MEQAETVSHYSVWLLRRIGRLRKRLPGGVRSGEAGLSLRDT